MDLRSALLGGFYFTTRIQKVIPQQELESIQQLLDGIPTI